ncbi:MAG: PepSY-associated TM helix domain-containing protein [Asticcacaulis sp.]
MSSAEQQSPSEKPSGNRNKPIWPKIPAGFVRAMLAGHSALGLAFAALIYVVCFSGAVAVFTEEFRQWENPSAPRVEAVSDDVMDKAFGAIIDKAPWAHGVFVFLPTADEKALRVTASPDFGDTEHKTLNYYADAEGNLRQEGSYAWTEFQAILHTRLHMPGMWGGFIVGLTGVALLSSLVSGILSHPRVFKDAFTLRFGPNKRLQEADIHNRISVWGLPFHVIVSLTGAFLGLTTIIVGVLALAVFKGDANQAYALFMGPHPVDDPRPAPRPQLQGMLVDLANRDPKAVPTYIMAEHPLETGAAVAINAQTPTHLSRGEMYVYDGKGAYLGNWGWEQGTLGQKIYAAMAPLHFGWFGGWSVKIIYAVLGMGLAAVTSSGVAIWLARRRDKGRPAPAWERLWTATVWSQPVAYTVVAISALVTRQETWLLPLWGGISLLSLIVSIFVDAKKLSLALRALSVVGLVAVAVVHAALALASGTPVGILLWAIDGACVLMAMALGLSLFWRRGAAPESK